MESSLINVNAPYKRVQSTWFSEVSLCLVFLKNNQLKIVLYQRSVVWSGVFCSPSGSAPKGNTGQKGSKPQSC